MESVSDAAPDWPPGIGDMPQFVRDHDWARTALGEIGGWPQHLRTAVEIVLASTIPAILTYGAEAIQIYNDAYRHVLGDLHSRSFAQPVESGLAQRRAHLESILRRVFRGESVLVRHEFIVDDEEQEDAAAQLRRFDFSWSPLRNERGGIVGALGIGFESARPAGAEVHQWTPLTELQHRVRNTLAVIRSVIRRTANSSRTVEDFAFFLEGRINTFARVQEATMRDLSAGLDLAQLVADEFLIWTAREEEQVSIAGPPVRLQPKTAETVALAIHELATVSASRGALSLPSGKIRVTWTLEPPETRSRLVLTWQEDSTAVSQAAESIETELLEQMLSYELKAETRFTFAPEGMTCTVLIPVTARTLAVS